MPFIATTKVPAGDLVGQAGKIFWATPKFGAASDFHEIPLPDDVNTTNLRESFSSYDGQLLVVGGHTANLIITGDWKCWRQGIRAPVLVPTVAASGTGLTADVVCYLSWYDENTDERSALSAPSQTISLANQGVAWTALPTDPGNDRVTHLEGWRSVDGSLPRLVWRRQVGVASVTESVAAGSLGEAFTEEFDIFPRCRFTVTWHGRQVMAGNDQEPDTLYFSLIDRPERWSGITLKTRTRQKIVGLAVVNDTLLVFCAFATEVVRGYTEDDLSIDIIQPQIGALSHFALAQAHGRLFVPTHLGAYLTDGSSWNFIGNDIQTEWIHDLLVPPGPDQNAYYKSWAIHNPVDRTFEMYIGLKQHGTRNSDNPSNGIPTYWSADYTPVVSQEGGGFGRPNWCYRTEASIGQGREFYSASTFAVPGGRHQVTYRGGTNGVIYKDNPGIVPDDFMRIRLSWNAFVDVGGDLDHGKKFTELDLFLQSEDYPWDLKVWTGDETCGDAQVTLGYSAADPAFVVTVPASAYARTDPDTGFLQAFRPKTQHHFVMPNAVGRGIVVEMVGQDMDFRGVQHLWKEGPVRRPLAYVQVE